MFYFTTFHQQVDEDGKLESAPQSEDLKPEETLSAEETEQEKQKPGSPLPQDEEKVAEFCTL